MWPVYQIQTIQIPGDSVNAPCHQEPLSTPLGHQEPVSTLLGHREPVSTSFVHQKQSSACHQETLSTPPSHREPASIPPGHQEQKQHLMTTKSQRINGYNHWRFTPLQLSCSLDWSPSRLFNSYSPAGWWTGPSQGPDFAPVPDLLGSPTTCVFVLSWWVPKWCSLCILSVCPIKNKPYSRTSENVRTFKVGDLVLLISIPNQKIVLSFKYILKYFCIFIFLSDYFRFDFKITALEINLFINRYHNRQ